MKDIVRIIHDADTIFYRIGHQHLGTEASDYIGAISTYMSNVLSKAESAASSIYPGCVVHHDICFADIAEPTTRYRTQFDKESVYKANRKNAPKPKFIPEMKSFTYNKYLIIPGIEPVCVSGDWGETDDFVSCHARQTYKLGYKCVISSCDKDLMQIHGWHYNYLKDTIYEISTEEANRNFFKQLLTGDVGDNIPGLKGVGPKKAGYLLDGLGTVEEMWDATLIAYTNHYKDTMSDDEISDVIYERANKLWLKRTMDQIWVPPIPDE